MGMAGEARQVAAERGTAWCGQDRPVEVRLGMERQARRGVAWLGMVRFGMVWQAWLFNS